ncbi:MAG TPA: M1 family aminopeptidase [Pirellulaceae bacterium]|nr:M1 family aminopeptidase [Pirellulaceae bacterium]
MQSLRLSLVVCLLLACSSAAAQQRSGPFNQPPRSLRSRTIDQKHVRLELTFDFDKQEFRGRAIHQLALFQPAREIALDAAEMKIESVTLSPLPATSEQAPVEPKFSQRDQSLTIVAGHELPAGSEWELSIAYSVAKPRHGAHFVAPDPDEPSQPQMVWTQSEPEYARFWLPCFDHPADRLTSEIVATVPSRFVTLSNGTLESKQENTDGTTTWHWRQAKSHVPYLLSIVAGDFEVLEQESLGIPVQSYVPRGRLADAPRSFEKTPAMLKLFSEKIGYKYPWPKYAQICVDEYSWGGMEHTSATTLNLNTLHDARAHHDVSSDNLVAHELAHQWFGDLMTCKDWGEIWLNESFATYFATLWTEHDQGWDEAAWDRHEEANSYLGEDGRYRRSIVNFRYTSPINVFDRHAYPKGGRVLHMLRHELGDEQFWRAIRRYVEVNQFRTVETADFRIAIEESTGQGLNWFFDQWLYKGGQPEFNVAWDYDSVAKQVRLTVKQTQKVDDLTPLFRTSAEIEIASGSSTPVMRRVTLSKAEETLHFDAPQRPTRVVFDPRDWILKKLTFDKPKEELLDQLAHDEHVMARVQAVQGLAGHRDEQDALAGLIATAKDDPFWAVRKEIVKVLGKCKGDEARAALIQAAKSDPKSFVRSEALIALQNFAHDDSRAAARHVVDNDESYFAAAEALKCLAKIDRENCRDLMLAALEKQSHDEVLLKAACDGLVELKAATASDAIAKLLDGELTPQRRAILISALARLKPDDAEALARVHGLLDNERVQVRRSAIECVASIGNPESIDKLSARRGKEEVPNVVNSIDEALAKLRERLQQNDSLRKELETLKKQNQQLEERLKKLEQPRTEN